MFWNQERGFCMTAMKYEEIEIFKDIEFNPYTKARYKVSTFGRVISKKTGEELKPYIRSGYPTVMLHISAIKRKHFPLHRLVAITFLPNPFQFPQVNHKDQDKLNPHLNNLEWCTAKYNINYGVPFIGALLQCWTIIRSFCVWKQDLSIKARARQQESLVWIREI